MKTFYTCLAVFACFAISRFVPHPPNFTSVQALSFYLPAILGLKFIPVVFLSFVITDIFIGFHQTLFFTWGSIILIGLISKYFVTNPPKHNDKKNPTQVDVHIIHAINSLKNLQTG